MIIEYTFSKDEQCTVRDFFKKRFIKRFVRMNKNKANSSDMIAKAQKNLAISIVFFILMLLGGLVFTYHFKLHGVIIYFTLLSLGCYVFSLISGSIVEMDRFRYLNAVKFIYQRRLRPSLSIGVNRYMKNVERLLKNGGWVEIDINGDLGKVSTSLHRKQSFSIRTLYLDSVIRDVAFYCFIDSQIRKRCIIPVPVRYAVDIERVLK